MGGRLDEVDNLGALKDDLEARGARGLEARGLLELELLLPIVLDPAGARAVPLLLLLPAPEVETERDETLPTNASLVDELFCRGTAGALPLMLEEGALLAATTTGWALALGGVGGQSSAVSSNAAGSFSSSEPHCLLGCEERKPIYRVL